MPSAFFPSFIDGAAGEEPGRDNRAGGDDVDANIIRPQLRGQTAGVFVDGGLGSGIDSLAGVARKPADTADIDNTAGFAGNHFRRDFSAAKNTGHEVTVEDSADIFRRNEDSIIGERFSGIFAHSAL